MLNDKIEKKNQLKKEQKKSVRQLGLTCQTCNLCHETRIT